MLLGCVILSFAPAVRMHTLETDLRWQQWVGFVVWVIGYGTLFVQANKYLPDRDPYLLPIISLLNGWGLLMIYRLDPMYGFRQTIWMALAIAAVVFALRIPDILTFLRRYKYVWLIGGILLTLLTFIIGVYPGGSGPGLWLSLGGLYVQPSEILKFLLVIYLAAYLADSFQLRVNLARLLTPTLILIGLAVLILVAQRDLGTASLFIILYTVVIYLASGKRRILLISFLLVSVALVIGYLVFDVIELRVEAWLNPWLDARGRSYQIVQSLIAVANGGLAGRGIGLGSPGVVPVAHSDFIFSAILEEFGTAGGFLIVSLFAFLTIRGFTIALHAPNQYQRFLAAGFSSYFATQSILIMGGTIRLLPLTGVTLPFVSYGGTSLVVSLAAGLILLLVSNQAEDHPAAIDRTKPYALIGGVYLAGFALIILLAAYWGVIRADDLLARGDNPRRAISDRYVYRGTIVDRNNRALTGVTGDTGAYKRILNYPPLSSVIGYSDPNYGQTGIEYYLDGILRGITYNSTSEIETTRLLYGQFPPGFDLRLSLDLPIQQTADELISNYIGSVVVMNAETGEILAMATSPTFDANQLDTNWETWMQDEDAPLLNRATQALYPPGATTGGVLLARIHSQYSLSTLVPAFSWTTTPGDPNFCAIQPNGDPSWGDLVSAGCIKALATINRSSSMADTLELYQQVGLFLPLNLPLEVSQPVQVDTAPDYYSLYSGDAGILVSPTQVAVVAATLSNGGKVVSPQIATAYRKPDGDWNLIAITSNPAPVEEFNADEAANLLSSGNLPGWEISAYALHEEAKISWFVAGTPGDWYGTPVVAVVALENGSPAAARQLGEQLFLQATTHNTQ
ncbi:MAG: FtsW/RodA/SpoVE family cell cycle protein [Anaerolineaceae bacterium]